MLAQATADAEAGVEPSGDYKGINNYTDYKKVWYFIGAASLLLSRTRSQLLD